MSYPEWVTLPWRLSWKRIHLQCGRPGFDPWDGKIPWRREWLPIQYPGLENSIDCIVQGVAMTERLSLPLSVSFSVPLKNGDAILCCDRTPPQCLLISGTNLCERLLFGLPLHGPFMALFPMPFPNCMLCLCRAPWHYSLIFLPFFIELLFPLSRTCPILYITYCSLWIPHPLKAFPSCPTYQQYQASSASLLAFIIAYLYNICICDSVLYTQTPQPVIILTVSSEVLVAQSCLTLWPRGL